MENEICPACKAENDEAAVYCDQCGQHLVVPDAADGDAEGGCPACGGVVESRGDGKGVCAGCGLELVETPEEPAPVKADAGTAARLTAAILEKTAAGRSVEEAVAEGCREVLGAPTSDSADKKEVEPLPCPLCGVENPHDAVLCGGCGLWFQRLRSPQTCPRCERMVADGQCSCGAVLTLPKLLEYIEPKVRFVCSRCRAPYAVAQPKCPDCGGGLISADRIKAFASDVGR